MRILCVGGAAKSTSARAHEPPQSRSECSTFGPSRGNGSRVLAKLEREFRSRSASFYQNFALRHVCTHCPQRSAKVYEFSLPATFVPGQVARRKVAPPQHDPNAARRWAARCGPARTQRAHSRRRLAPELPIGHLPMYVLSSDANCAIAVAHNCIGRRGHTDNAIGAQT